MILDQRGRGWSDVASPAATSRGRCLSRDQDVVVATLVNPSLRRSDQLSDLLVVTKPHFSGLPRQSSPTPRALEGGVRFGLKQRVTAPGCGVARPRARHARADAQRQINGASHHARRRAASCRLSCTATSAADPIAVFTAGQSACLAKASGLHSMRCSGSGDPLHRVAARLVPSLGPQRSESLAAASD